MVGAEYCSLAPELVRTLPMPRTAATCEKQRVTTRMGRRHAGATSPNDNTMTQPHPHAVQELRHWVFELAYLFVLLRCERIENLL